MNKKGIHWREIYFGILFVFVLLVVLFVFLRGTSYGKPFDSVMKSLGIGGDKETVIDIEIAKIGKKEIKKPVVPLTTEADRVYKKGNWEKALVLYEESYSTQEDDKVKDKIIEILKEKAKFYEIDEDFESAKESYLKLQTFGENVNTELARMNDELSKPVRTYTDVKDKECRNIRSFIKRHECAAKEYIEEVVFLTESYSLNGIDASEHERAVILGKYFDNTNKFAQAVLVEQYKILSDNFMNKQDRTSEEDWQNKKEAYAIYNAIIDKFWVDEEVEAKLKEAYNKDNFNYVDTQFPKVKFYISLESSVYASRYDTYNGWWWKPAGWAGSIDQGGEEFHKFIVKIADLRDPGRWSMLPSGVYTPRDERDINCIAIKEIPGQVPIPFERHSTGLWALTYEARDLLGQRLCKGTYYSYKSISDVDFKNECEKYFKISLTPNSHITCDKKGDEEWMEFKISGDIYNLGGYPLRYMKWENDNLLKESFE